LRVLVVEDSERLARSLLVGLRHAGFAVDLASDGQEAIAGFFANDYELMVLDLNLPKIDGLSVLETIRSRGSNTPILILSARDRIEDRIRGLEMGADDYLVKPFAFDELTARLRTLARRRYQNRNPLLTIGPLAIDTRGRRVSRDGREVSLTATEFRLLEFLALRRGHVFSKSHLINSLYEVRTNVTENAVEVLVSELRRKIQRADEPPIIKTRRGFGYLIEAPVEADSAAAPAQSIEPRGPIDRR
jgi:DNA-binding response OmpR family regulator